MKKCVHIFEAFGIFQNSVNHFLHLFHGNDLVAFYDRRPCWHPFHVFPLERDGMERQLTRVFYQIVENGLQIEFFFCYSKIKQMLPNTKFNSNYQLGVFQLH